VRLAAAGYPEPEWLHFVPVDFEAGDSWRDELRAAGFDPSRPAVVASTGVSMYLTKETTAATLRQVAGLPPGSLLAMTFLVPTDLVDAADRPGYEAAMAGAERSGTPFISLYAPEEMLGLARAAGFAHAEHVSSQDLTARYFAGRPDGLRPSTGEDFLVATT
jgi:methyltransferase (TIGR00027 family)